MPKLSISVPHEPTSTTRLIADKNGQLLPGVERAETSSNNFVGTWHMPKKIYRKTANILNGLESNANNKNRRNCVVYE